LGPLQWVPELRDVPAHVIHTWYEEKSRAGYKKYPSPMITHANAAKETLHAYRSI
jgi:deoxyribodipyrimidine photolyase